MQPICELPNTFGDIVTDEAHPFDAIDATFRWVVGIPVLQAHPGRGLFIGDVDADLE